MRTASPSRRRAAPRRRRLLCLTAALVPTALDGALSGCTGATATATVPIPGGVGRGVPVVVTHVVDGDTVEVRLPDGSTDRVRLLGIDTPETVKPNTPVQCYGPEASARTKALVPDGTDVLLQRDVEARDRYGRLLAYVWRRRDGLFVNRSLVADGHARTLSIAPNTAHRVDLSQVQNLARQGGLGLWGACPVTGSDRSGG